MISLLMAMLLNSRAPAEKLVVFVRRSVARNSLLVVLVCAFATVAAAEPRALPLAFAPSHQAPLVLIADTGDIVRMPPKPQAAPPPAPPPVALAPVCDGVEAQVGNDKRCLKPKDGFKDCDMCPEMVVVPAGSFMMGSPQNEPDHRDDEIQRRVSIPAPFAVGKFAVTFDEWDACVADGGCNGYKPDDRGWGRGRHPVINVSWDDAKGYTAWLSRKTGMSYRLPSEAEREYVTRAGTTTPFWWGSSITPEQANYLGSNRKRTVPVDSFEPNPWGLYNVHGNVWEWTEDCWNDSKSGPVDCSVRVIRGGSWGFDPVSLRSAMRDWGATNIRRDHFGFRLRRTLTP